MAGGSEQVMRNNASAHLRCGSALAGLAEGALNSAICRGTVTSVAGTTTFLYGRVAVGQACAGRNTFVFRSSDTVLNDPRADLGYSWLRGCHVPIGLPAAMAPKCGIAAGNRRPGDCRSTGPIGIVQWLSSDAVRKQWTE
jgi:hypothetical protein